MRRILLYTLLVILLNISVRFSNAQEPAWKFHNQDPEIKSCTRIDAKNNLYELKASTVFHCRLDEVALALCDVKEFPKWVSSVKYNRLIKKNDLCNQYYYSYNDIPWPLEDRDVLLHMVSTYNQEEKTFVNSNTCFDGNLPLPEGVVRLENVKIVWTAKETSENEVLVEYYFACDPVGSVPKWLVDEFFVKSPVQSIHNLKLLIEEKKMYIGGKFECSQ